MSNLVPLLSVQNLYKKFSRDIKYNLYYGLRDILGDLFGWEKQNMLLREKEFQALHNINFDLFNGDILGIVGANGSGKTTLMRVISGIYYPEAGGVYKLPEKKITTVFALGIGMQPLFTGRENVFIKGAMYGMSREEVEDKITFIEQFSELKAHLDSPLGNYSSGMRARLAFAIALATEPDVFILDEALAVGDTLFKTKCFEHLKEYVRKPEKAVLFVSNSIKKVLKVANRVIVMKEGSVIYESSKVKKALNYYILNCLDHVDEDQRQIQLKKVNDYEM